MNSAKSTAFSSSAAVLICSVKRISSKPRCAVAIPKSTAQRPYLSEGTARDSGSSLLAKLDVADRTQAAVLALRHGVVAGGEAQQVDERDLPIQL